MPWLALNLPLYRVHAEFKSVRTLPQLPEQLELDRPGIDLAESYSKSVDNYTYQNARPHLKKIGKLSYV